MSSAIEIDKLKSEEIAHLREQNAELWAERAQLAEINQQLSLAVAKDLVDELYRRNDLYRLGLRELLQDLVKCTAAYRYARTTQDTGSGVVLSAYDAMYQAEERASKFLRELEGREGVRYGE